MENSSVSLRSRPPPENKPSLLLSKEENQTIFDILGKGRQTLSTAVVQLLVPTPDQSNWQKKDTGVLCLVRDTGKKSYFIQVLSLKTKSMIFRQEIYSQFDYHMPKPFFITFEGDIQVVGINFADNVEANNFKEALDTKLESKRQRRHERRSRYLESQQSHHNIQNNNIYSPKFSKSSYTNGNNNNNNNNINENSAPSSLATSKTFTTSLPSLGGKKKGKDKGDKRKVRKEDIGLPTDFRHVQHVGWDSNKGFDLTGVDNDYKSFFEKAGISANELEDENTRKFIYDFIDSNGGFDAVKREVQSPVRPPPPPISQPQTPQQHQHVTNSNNLINPPPVPARQPTPKTTVKSIAPKSQQQQNTPPGRPMPPAPLSSPAPPPPPPQRSTSNQIKNTQQQTRSPYNNNNNNNRGVNNNSNNSTSAPPPPPLPVGGIPPPPPPPPPQSVPSEDETDLQSSRPSQNQRSNIPPVEDNRSELMKQIQSGVNLKKVEPTEQVKRPTNTLADCLNQIKEGVGLKHVEEPIRSSAQLDAQDGLAGALARALKERAIAINPDSSSSDDDDIEDDDEWE